MDIYNPKYHRFDIDKLPSDNWVKIQGIPEGVEQYDTVRLVTKYPSLMYRACVIEISPDEDCLWLSYDKNFSVWP